LLNVEGTQNCAYGTDALVYNGFGVTGGNFNNAFGSFALYNNSDGYENNAVGNHALFENLHGAANTAVGDLALQNNGENDNIFANFNTAVGASALHSNSDGDSNNAVGAAFLYGALGNNTIGVQNNAMGVDALGSSIDGSSNVAVGDSAFADNVDGSFNTVVGWDAGTGVEGEDNIYIGATAGLPGGGSETGYIRIGDPLFVTVCYIAGITGVESKGGVPVCVDVEGQLAECGPASPISQLKATTEKQAARIASQEGQINALTAALRQQADQIQKVSAQLEMIKPAPQVVENR